MVKKVYSIFDTVSGLFGVPFLFDNDALAVREFCAVVPRLPYPKDVVVVYLGRFDDETGVFENDKHSYVISGTSALEQLRKQKEEEVVENGEK